MSHTTKINGSSHMFVSSPTSTIRFWISDWEMGLNFQYLIIAQ